MRAGLITYEGLPISSGGAHVLRARPIREQWAAVELFLHACTDFTLPSRLELVLHGGERVPRAFVEAVRPPLARWFGAPKRAHTISGAVNEHALWWYPNPADLAAVRWASGRSLAEPLPPHRRA